MEYSKIIAVTGLPGLYELITSKGDGAIVKSLDDKSSKFVSSRIHNFSHLESIEIFTTHDNVNLVEVFNAMEKSSTALPDGKDNGDVKKYFEKVYPEMDFERVYSSDMKKMIKWFAVLKENNIEIKLSEAPEEEVAEPVIEKETVAEEKPKKPAKKAEPAAEAPKKKEPAKASAVKPKEKAVEEKPKKPAKKKETAKEAPKKTTKKK